MDKLTAWLNSLASAHTPSFAECVQILGAKFPLLHDLARTEQDAIWHAEGNVAIHTEMVLQSLYTLLGSMEPTIVGRQRQTLILAALLHDIAKPMVTKRKHIGNKARVVAPKHEKLGADYLAVRLMALPLAHTVVKDVLSLVAYHNIPKLLVIRNAGFDAYFKLSLEIELSMLYWLEMADMQGRVCQDQNEQLDILEQFKMFAEEYALWSVDDPRSEQLKRIQVKQSPREQDYLNAIAVSQLAHGEISVIEEAIAKNFQAAQNYAHLYIMCGVSGSGKSTWISQHLTDFELVSLDEIRKELNGKRACQKNRGQVLQLAKSRLKSALANKRNVVWDATNIRKDFRKLVCDFGVNYGALTTLVIFHKSEQQIRAGNRNREYIVDEEIISKQISRFEWPSATEAHRVMYVVN